MLVAAMARTRRREEERARIRAADFRNSLSGHFLHPPVDEYDGILPDTLWAPRRLLEALTRKIVRDRFPEIEFVEGTLTTFQLDDNVKDTPNTVNAVNIRLPNGHTREIPDCTLAVDCTGAAQSGFKALSRILPALSVPGLRDGYDTNIVYASLEYPLPPNFYENLSLGCTDDTAADFAYIPDPDVDNKLVALLRRDTNGVVFTMGGWDVNPPVTLDEVRLFAKQVRHQAHIPDRFYHAIDLLEPVKHLGTVHLAHNIHYEQLSQALPRNYVAIGDSAMRVNPRFGQGVSKCTIGAVTLDALLRTLPPTDRNFGARFFSMMHDRTDNIWDTTKIADYALDTTTPVAGESRETGRLKLWYRSHLLRSMETVSHTTPLGRASHSRAAPQNPAAASAVWHTMMFLAPPTDVFAPSIIAGIVRNILVDWMGW
ncbi:hypothetical protein AURDEDRAFT_127718 [Auricularia subglabra TFB-10046 SS5]|nr:hypothetical protein AURDEDRAFT_127718 [Auricularia subglabra TFB-10046 SS5]